MANTFKPYPMPKTKPKMMGAAEPDADEKTSAKPMPKRMGAKGCPKR